MYNGYVVRKVKKVVETEERVFEGSIPEYKPLRHAVISRSKTDPIDVYVIGLFPSQWAALYYIETSKFESRVWEYMELV